MDVCVRERERVIVRDVKKRGSVCVCQREKEREPSSKNCPQFIHVSGREITF